MANENELEVIFGADDKSLSKTIANIQADLKTFNSQLQKVGDVRSFDELNTKLATTKTNVERIKTVNLAEQLSKIRPNASQAATSLTNLARVAQDAPFGFIAIANNLDPLFDSFRRLQVESGSTGGAIKAFASGLLGAGGLAIAISTITSLVTVAIQKYGSLSNAIKALSSGDNIPVVAQMNFNKALIEANKNAGEEIAKLRVLTAVASDTTRKMAERIEAVKLLRQEFKPYFQDLTNEQILNGGVANAVLKARDAIIARARATAANARLSEIESELLDIEVKRTAATDDYTKSLDNLNNAQKNNLRNQQISRNTAFTPVVTGELIGAQAAFDSAKKALLDLGDQEQKFIGEREFLIQRINEEDLVIPPIKLDKPKTDKVEKTLAEIFAKIRKDQEKMWGDLFEFSDKEADKYFDEWEKSITANDKKQAIIDAFNGTNEAIKKGIVGISAAGAPLITDQNLPAIDQQSQILQRFKELGQNPPDLSWLTDISAQNLLLIENLNQTYTRLQNIGAVVNEFVAPALQTFFNDLISGSQTALEAVVSFLKNLVKQLIVTIATAAALAAIMSAFGGGGFSGLFKKFLGFGGGGGGSPFSGGAGPSGLALAGAATGSSFGSELNFRLDGNDLVASINRTNQSNGRMGG